MRFNQPVLQTVLMLATSAGILGAEGERLDFNKDVRPILSQYCFKCHGMDDKSRKGGLRLDTREGATGNSKSGQKAVIAGKPEASELVHRLRSTDPEEVMPPPSTKVRLPAGAAAILERWIQEGAEYAPHWAFVAPKPQALPSVQNSEWSRTAVDRFILARLEKEGLSPSKEASKAALLRRVYLDLTGLPPTPEEADAFESDPSPDAYETIVDKLLASPHYGERWARRWLDLARYADTNGYEKDRPRTIWPYRDWVVKAFNSDMPFDQFTIRQLAGDLLPNATSEDRVATGFHRNTMLNEEGGIDPLEFRFHAMTDRVGTTATAWLGMTFSCAQCHTHKYDPILHTDYYRLMAIFNNTEEPDFNIPSEAVETQREKALAKIAALRNSLPERFEIPPDTTPNQPAEDAASAAARRHALIQKRFEEWQANESAGAVSWQILRPERMEANLAKLAIQPDGSILASGDCTKLDTYTLRFSGGSQKITAIRLEALPDVSLPAGGPGRAYYEGPKGDFFLSEISFLTNGKKAGVSAATHSYAKGSIGGSSKVGAQFAIDGDPSSGWATDGAQGKSNSAVFQFDEPLDVSNGLEIGMLFERHYACPLGRFRISATVSNAKQIQAKDYTAEIEAALSKAASERTKDEQDLVFQRFLETAPETAAVRKEIDALQASIPKLQQTLVFQERPATNPRPTHLYHRGEFTQPQEEVAPAVPSFLPPLTKGTRADRLAFARWLFTEEHPLTARVAVNREWQALFGRGLVRTVEDFGYQGEMPSHPELLDWLAVEFRNQGWSLKKLHRLLVTSAVYRQDSAAREELAARDPQNVLISRGPRFRREAEIIRDSALKAAGLLSLKMGGPGVYPSQNPAITKEGTYGGFDWKPSPGEDRYRRTLYTFMKRTAPFAMGGTFDAPTGEACIARRESSNSPLQALTLLNDVIFQEAAQALGKIGANAGLDDAARVRLLFRRCLTREPAAEETGALLEFLNRQRDRLRALASTPESAAPDKKTEAIAANEERVWSLVGRAILNLDEMITKN